jgi:hypothetical protein
MGILKIALLQITASVKLYRLPALKQELEPKGIESRWLVL